MSPNYNVSADTTATLNVIRELLNHYENICTLFEDGELTEDLQTAFDVLLKKEKEFLADRITGNLYQNNEFHTIDTIEI